MSFHSLNIIDPVLRSLEQEGYQVPTPIQQQAIPVILQHRDLLGCAQTGTGKTAAFAIPVLQLLYTSPQKEKKGKIRALIVTPTRELAIQIEENLKNYGRYLNLGIAVVYGGVNQNPQTLALKKGVDILIATPGRLLDLMQQGFIGLQNIELFILDEADRMLDMGFIHDVKKIIASLPRKRQSLFFSATMPPEIVKLSESILFNPVKVEITPSATPVDIISQWIFFVEKSNKPALLMKLLSDANISSVLVFTRTKHGADRVARTLCKNKISAEAIHGNKAQNARQRALRNFKERSTRVLVATDIAARGIDIEDMEYVINYDIPNIPETYVHRIGRTGRAGAGGTACSFCDHDEKPYLKDIEKLIGKKIPVNADNPFPLEEKETASDSRGLTQAVERKKSNRSGFRHRPGQPRNPAKRRTF